MEIAIYDHFRGVFSHPGSGSFTMDFQALEITLADLSALDLPFSEEEVEMVMREMPSKRAPGPDSYTGAFYKSALAGHQVRRHGRLNALFFGDSRAFGWLNNTYVILLPKKPYANTPGDSGQSR